MGNTEIAAEFGIPRSTDSTGLAARESLAESGGIIVNLADRCRLWVELVCVRTGDGLVDTCPCFDSS